MQIQALRTPKWSLWFLATQKCAGLKPLMTSLPSDPSSPALSNAMRRP